jgi:glyceraldehyde-3-phosphate dehydrogenase/erythrose-4-phosphate dehydrogenase
LKKFLVVTNVVVTTHYHLEAEDIRDAWKKAQDGVDEGGLKEVGQYESDEEIIGHNGITEVQP